MKSILLRPVISEKTLSLAAKGWYTFMVAKSADKKTVVSAVAGSYAVQVIDVRVMNVHGKVRRVGKQMRYARRQDWKKAMVRLKAGQKIDAFEVAPNEQGATV